VLPRAFSWADLAQDYDDYVRDIDPDNGSPLAFWAGSGNKFEGCCLFNNEWWMGGTGTYAPCAKDVLAILTCPNTPGASNYQYWEYDFDRNVVDYPNPKLPCRAGNNCQ